MLHTVRSFAVIALSFTSFGALAGGIVTTTKVPVKITMDPAAAEAMSDEDRHAVDAVRKQIEANVWTYDQFEIQAPETIFSETPIVRVADFQPPTGNELQDLATNPDGSPVKLSPEQIESIRDTSLLIVPSQKFPGKNHVWKVALWLQKGRENVEIDLNQAKANALGQLTIHVPQRFLSEDPISARHGIVSVLKGLQGSLKLLVGLVEKTPLHSDAEISSMIRKQVQLDARRELATESYNRLYNSELMEKVEKRVADIVSDFDKAWPAFQEEMVPVLIEQMAKDYSPEEIATVIKHKLELARLNGFHSLLKEDKALEELSAGIGGLLVNRDLALRMSMTTELQISQDIGKFSEEAGEKIDAEYPVRSKIATWRKRQVQEAVEAFAPEIREKRVNELLVLMRSQKLHMEADILEKSLQFFKERAHQMRSELGRELIASRIVNLQNRIFFAENWKRGIHRAKDGTVTYYPIKYDKVSVTSDYPAWRLNLVAQRTRMLWRNWNYNMIINNLLNGPVGLKALVYKHPFAPFMTVDEKTGNLKVDESVTFSPLIARHRSIWQWVKAAKEKFESQPQRGFISKDTLRPFYNGVTNLKGAALTLGLWTLQPTLTVANTAVTAAVAGTSVAWAPLSSALWWMFDASIYDTANPNSEDPKRLPLVQKLVFQGGLGSVEAVGSTLAGGIGHPVLAGGYYLAGQTRAKARTAWDSLMNLIFIKRANLPAGDSMLIHRVSGPELSSQYLFQVNPEVVLVALQAHMEGLELSAFEEWTSALIAESEISLKSYIQATVGQIGLSTNERSRPEWVEQVENRAQEIREKLYEEMKLGRLKLPQAISREAQGRVRLKQADLEILLAMATPAVQKFWENRMRHLLGKKESKYWQDKALVQNDFAGLTKRLLQDTFGQEFLTPLEKNDDNFVVQVSSPDFKRLLDHIIDGEPINPVTLVEERLRVPALASKIKTEIQFGSVLTRSLSNEPCESLMLRL